MAYGLLMLVLLMCALTWSLQDQRLIREVGVWVKPMKFMASTSLFAFTTAWVVKIANSRVDQTYKFVWIVALMMTTSLFEVGYISYQAAQAEASHYNVTDEFHAFMFGLMAVAAVGLTGSQAWLAWEIWSEQKNSNITVVTWSVIIGLIMTFVLTTVSGFMLGSRQPPAGQWMPLLGWHWAQDIRPSHFLGVHAQQLIPLWGVMVSRFPNSMSKAALLTGCALYIIVWCLVTWLNLTSFTSVQTGA